MKNPSTRFRKGKRDVNARNGLVMIFVCTKFSVRARACSQCCVAFITVSICHVLRKRTPFSAWWVLQEGIGEKRWTGTPKHLFLSWQYKRILNAMNENKHSFPWKCSNISGCKDPPQHHAPKPCQSLTKKKGERSSVADVGDDDIQFISHRVAGCYATYAAQGALDPDCHKRPAPYILFFSHHCVKAVSRLPLLLRQPCQDKRWAEVHTKG